MLPALVAACLPALSGAQSPAHLAVEAALGNLRSSTSVWMRLDANETLGNTTRARTIHSFWTRSFDAQGRMTAKSELRDFDEGVLAMRLVGDGNTFWRFDPRANTYSAKRYGSYDGTTPPTYLQDLLQSLTAASEGHATYLVRVIKETFGGGVAKFTGWMPADLAPTLHTTGSVADPVLPSRTYAADPTREFALFHTQLPGAERSLVFEIDKSNGRKLQAIYYAERDLVGQRNRLREWTTSVWPNFIPAGVNYVFTAPQGATPIAHRGGG